jgi:transcriptional regulator with XRE-family HTH domain
MAYYKDLVTFGARVRAKRIEQKCSPKELARRLGMSVETLYEIECGAEHLTIVRAQEIARMLRVPLNELLKPDESFHRS